MPDGRRGRGGRRGGGEARDARGSCVAAAAGAEEVAACAGGRGHSVLVSSHVKVKAGGPRRDPHLHPGLEVRLLRRQTKTTLEVSLLEKYPCSQFIIAVGNNAVAFLSAFVMNSGVWEEVGCAKLWNEWCRTTDTLHMSPSEAHCVFYHLKSTPSVILCQCSCYVAEDQQYQWLDKVFGSCPRKNMQVTVLTCRHVTDYKTSESTGSLPSPFLKALKTQNFRDPVCCSLLEQPNIVHDLPAAVLSHCQVWRLPAVLYLCYTDVMKLDLLTAAAFQPVLASRSLKGLAKNIPQSTEILKRLMTLNEVQSNIYT
ncbi:proteasome assembly chaperone 1 isoform X1 [Cavia porcellus]|uniref:proteasome assembly chaperone 1 isoform X1 n=1 Tax=Cavia porcellus TaxID=10141 RepID=UPI002FE2DD3D